MQKHRLPNGLKEKATIYLNLWRNKWEIFVKDLSDNEWDLSSAIYILDALYPRERMREIALSERIIETN